MGVDVAKNLELRLRMGKFYFAPDLLGHQVLFRLFALVIPVRVEQRFDLRAFEVIGCSYLFDKLPLGTEVPTYTISFSGDTGEFSISRA